jgi:hypothetical protein
MFKRIALFVFLGAVMVSSCKKKEFDSDTQTAVDYAYVKMGYNTTLPITNQITVNEEGVRAAYTCANVSYISGDTANWPQNNDTIVYLVDFGSGCTDVDGRFKTGYLNVYFYSDFSQAGGQVKMIPSNYKVDGIQYDGTILFTNNGNYSYSRTITNGVCTGNGWTITYNGTTTLNWIAGYTTPLNSADDSYSFFENSSGTNRNQKAYSVEIPSNTPLVKDCNCKWIKSGTVNITPEGLATRSLDFGTGACDNKAVMTINGRTFEFEMQ